MARPLRFQFPGAFYHVMNRGANRNPIFLDPQGDRMLFISAIKRAVYQLKIKVHAYSLMPNHYHLLVETPLGNLSRAMRQIDGIYTQRFNKKHNRDGPLMRGRFKSILVQKNSYFLELVRYIHLNGTRANLVSSPEKDLNSSHVLYVNNKQSAFWLTRDLALSYFSGPQSQQIQSLHQFVLQGVRKDLKQTLSRKRWPAILGDDTFIKGIKDKFGLTEHTDKERDVPQRKEVRTYNLIPAEKIEKQVLDFFRLSSVQELDRRSRWIMARLLRFESQLTNQDIGERMGGITEGMVRKILRTKIEKGDEIVEKLGYEFRT